MIQHLARNWWVMALRGVSAILFGLLAFTWPGLTLSTLVLLFGAFQTIHGVVTIIGGFNHPKGEPRHGHFLLQGLASIALGIFTFVFPGITTVVLLFLIAAWSILMGGFEVFAGIRLRKV